MCADQFNLSKSSVDVNFNVYLHYFMQLFIYSYIVIYCFNLHLRYWEFISADFSSVVPSVAKTLRIANLSSLNTWNNTYSF